MLKSLMILLDKYFKNKFEIYFIRRQITYDINQFYDYVLTIQKINPNIILMFLRLIILFTSFNILQKLFMLFCDTYTKHLLHFFINKKNKHKI